MTNLRSEKFPSFFGIFRYEFPHIIIPLNALPYRSCQLNICCTDVRCGVTRLFLIKSVNSCTTAYTTVLVHIIIPRLNCAIVKMADDEDDLDSLLDQVEQTFTSGSDTRVSHQVHSTRSGKDKYV